jgi:hypothetical protein
VSYRIRDLSDQTCCKNMIILRFNIIVAIDFFLQLTIRLIQKIVQVQFILFAIYFNVVCILNLTYHFTSLRKYF